jgi:hypothetical protein
LIDNKMLRVFFLSQLSCHLSHKISYTIDLSGGIIGRNPRGIVLAIICGYVCYPISFERVHYNFGNQTLKACSKAYEAQKV